MIKVNMNAAEVAVEKAYKECVKQTEAAAEKGQKYVTLSFWCPNYGDGMKVKDKMEKLGVECCERGFDNNKNHDGSYDFFVKCKIKE